MPDCLFPLSVFVVKPDLPSNKQQLTSFSIHFNTGLFLTHQSFSENSQLDEEDMSFTFGHVSLLHEAGGLNNVQRGWLASMVDFTGRRFSLES